MSAMAIILLDKVLGVLDDALDAYVDKKIRQPRLKKWAEENPDARVVYPQKPRVHLSVDEALAAARGHIATKKEGEERFKELSGQFPKAWQKPQ